MQLYPFLTLALNGCEGQFHAVTFFFFLQKSPHQILITQALYGTAQEGL
jgi:hypothetical protein